MTSATQGPIPIARGEASSNGSGEGATSGRSGSYLGLSASFGGSNSFRDAMAISFGKDVAEYVVSNTQS